MVFYSRLVQGKGKSIDHVADQQEVAAECQSCAESLAGLGAFLSSVQFEGIIGFLPSAN